MEMKSTSGTGKYDMFDNILILLVALPVLFFMKNVEYFFIGFFISAYRVYYTKKQAGRETSAKNRKAILSNYYVVPAVIPYHNDDAVCDFCTCAISLLEMLCGTLSITFLRLFGGLHVLCLG